jgi:hypothetical protein
MEERNALCLLAVDLILVESPNIETNSLLKAAMESEAESPRTFELPR